MRLALKLAPRTLAATLLVTASYVGCAAVPDIRFVSDAAEGGTDASTSADAATDGNASNDGSVVRDAAPTCTTASPGGGATCCGDVWCIGDCSSANCDQCASKGCQAGEFCCGKMGTVVCKTRCP
jgi:hypothetical protein